MTTMMMILMPMISNLAPSASYVILTSVTLYSCRVVTYAYVHHVVKERGMKGGRGREREGEE